MLEGLTQFGLMKDLETAAHHSMLRAQGGLEGDTHGSSVETLLGCPLSHVSGFDVLINVVSNNFKCEAATDFSEPNTSQELKLICDERGKYSGGRGLLVVDSLS